MEACANAGRWKDLRTPDGARLKLSDHTLKVLAANGFQQMTPVQAACLPLFLTHKDVAVEAVTGSGKTLAFVVPAVEMLLRRPPTRPQQISALMIGPTRELAMQIFEVVQMFAVDEAFSSLLLIGGRSTADDEEAFTTKGGNIIVGTPGRLEDTFKRIPSLVGYCKEMEVLILDEADRLLDMGFEATLTSILSYLPKQRRTGLFSATQTKQVEALMKAGLRNPVKISVKVEQKAKGQVQATPASLTIQYLMCEPTDKLGQLVQFMNQERAGKAKVKFIVYFCTCACVDYFWKILSSVPELKGLEFFHLHRKIAHKGRTATYEKFKQTDSAVLVCTDVAARGLDIPDIDFVIQYDPPQDPDAFVHRCGRTARLGKEGKAVVFLLPKEDAYVEFLKIRKVPVTELAPLPGAPDVHSRVRKLAAKDREVYEKGKLAFVSFIRSYKEHKCSYIFRFKDLDLAKLAEAFALLHLPAMPEIKTSKSAKAFVESDVEQDKIPFKDKVREKRRLEKLKERQEAPKERKPKKQVNAPWSEKMEQKARKQKRKMRKIHKAQEKRKADQMEEDEWDQDELAAEARLTKKLKQGKITADQFDAAMKEFEAGGSGDEM